MYHVLFIAAAGLSVESIITVIVGVVISIFSFFTSSYFKSIKAKQDKLENKLDDFNKSFRKDIKSQDKSLDDKIQLLDDKLSKCRCEHDDKSTIRDRDISNHKARLERLDAKLENIEKGQNRLEKDNEKIDKKLELIISTLQNSSR